MYCSNLYRYRFDLPVNSPVPKSVAKQSDARPTLKTVAEACGLAVTTVSRALNDGDDIALRTREKVKLVAEQLGYVPNRAGRGLRTGRSQILSLVLSPHAAITGYTAAIISGLGEVCRDSGYELSATPAFPDQDELTIIRSIVQNKRADGIVLSRIKPQDIRVRYLLECGFPFVTHGRTELASVHAFVDFDNQRFTEMAAIRLAKRGRKRLMLIGPPVGLTYQAHMDIGFKRGAALSGVETIESAKSISLETPLDELRHTIKQQLRSKQAPDGIVCGGELSAIATLASIRDAGLTPGIDIDVYAKQTSTVLDHMYPAIDACYEDIVQTGLLLGQTLLRVIQNDQPMSELSKLIEPEVRIRT